MRNRLFYKELQHKINNSSFVKDTTWAVMGNGIGSGLMLIAGIIIARFLGKELYGEYGMVKVTMIQIATFATFGLSYTSTKFIAEYLIKEVKWVPSIVRAAVFITFLTSSILCLLVIVFAPKLALYCNAPSLTMPFRVLGFLIIIRALDFVLEGIIGGFKQYKKQGVNNIISGFFFVLICIPLTYWGGLIGALTALSLCQIFLCCLNARVVFSCIKGIKEEKGGINSLKMLFSFSLPVAGQELTYFMVSWLCPIFIVRYSTLGELGIYNACAQWYSICLYIPNLLRNVAMAYLSSSSGKPADQKKLVYRMLSIDITCCTIVFIIVGLLSPLIVSFYGDSFIGMRNVLSVLIFSSIFQSIIVVFSDNMVVEGKNWQMFLLRTFRDIMTIGLFVTVLVVYSPVHSAFAYSIIQTIISIFYAILLASLYRIQHRTIKQ